MIVVAGPLGLAGEALTGAAAVAARAAGAGARVEAVGVVSPDPVGDTLLLRLAAAGVGHAAVLRTPAAVLDGPDLELALRYLPDIRAIVLIDATAELAATAGAAAAWAAAPLVVVLPAGADRGGGASAAGDGGTDVDRTIVLAAPRHDPDGAFGGFVAALAVRLAEGARPADAWTDTARSLGVEALGRDARVEPPGTEPVSPGSDPPSGVPSTNASATRSGGASGR